MTAETVDALVACDACEQAFPVSVVALIESDDLVAIERLCRDELNRPACTHCGTVPTVAVAPTLYVDRRRNLTFLVPSAAPMPPAYRPITHALPPPLRRVMFLDDGAALRDQLRRVRALEQTDELFGALAGAHVEAGQILDDHADLVNEELFASLARLGAANAHPTVMAVLARLLDHVGVLDDPEPIGAHERWIIARCAALSLGDDGPPWLAGGAATAEELVTFADAIAARVRTLDEVAARFALCHLSVALAWTDRLSASPGGGQGWARVALWGAMGAIYGRLHGRDLEAWGYSRLALRELEAIAGDVGLEAELERRAIRLANCILRAEQHGEGRA